MPRLIVADPKKASAKDRDAFECLSLKMQLFVMEYIQDHNATRAAKEVGYKNPSVMGTKLLKRLDIKKAIAHVMKPTLDELELNHKGVMGQLQKFLFFDPTEVLDENGNLKCKNLKKLPKELRQCIQGFKITPHYDSRGNLLKKSIEVQFVSKTAAMGMALKALSMITEQHHHTFSFDALYKETPEPITVEGKLLSMLNEVVTEGKDAKPTSTK